MAVAITPSLNSRRNAVPSTSATTTLISQRSAPISAGRRRKRCARQSNPPWLITVNPSLTTCEGNDFDHSVPVLRTPVGMILQNDFKRQWEVVQDAVIGAVRRVGASGSYILGEEVRRFEEALARLWGVSYAIGVANGMDAIEIGLRCLDVRPGDKVLPTPLSAFATTLAISRAGGIPVFVDVDDLGRIDLGQCRDVLKRNRAIRFLVPVHLYGFPLDLAELAALRDEFELQIVEDCAQAIGASASSTGVGTVGQVAATSFYPTKNLGAMGDGGAL